MKSQFYGTSRYIGGGTLIHKSFVLTLATKVNNEIAADLIARVGEFDFTTDSETFQHEEYNVKKIIIHEYFKLINARPNNIALLELKRPVELGQHINIICLPPSDVKYGNKIFYATTLGKK